MVFARYFLLGFLFVCLNAVIHAGNGFEVRFKLHNSSDELFYLARYYGERVYMVDTSYSDKPGQATFSGNTKLEEGIYLLVSGEKVKLLEFIIDGGQYFEILLDSMAGSSVFEVKNSQQNSLFFENIQLSSAISEAATKLKEMADIADDAQLASALNKRDSLVGMYEAFKENLVLGFPDYLLTKIVLAMEDVKIPDTVNTGTHAAYYFYKQNYWNNIDLEDKRLLHTPLLPNKIRSFFDQFVPPVADSIIEAIDHLIKLSGNNNETRDYLVWHFTSEYQNPKIMGLDKVFVHLADDYFAKYEIANTSETVRTKILKRADQLRNLLIGAKAPDLRLVDTTGQFVSFQQIDKQYIVLFFWDFDCGICKKDLLVLKDLYDSKKYNFEVYAISTNADMEGWKKYIRENGLDWVNVNGTRSITANFHDLYDIYGTPVIYVLDNKKNIIAKRITAEQLELVFGNTPER
jgi:peroxiredoxin